MQVFFEEYAYQARMDAVADGFVSWLFQCPVVLVEVGKHRSKEFIGQRCLVPVGVYFDCTWKMGKIAGKGLENGRDGCLIGEKLPVYVVEEGRERAGDRVMEKMEFAREIVLVIVQQPAFLQEVEKHQANKQARSAKAAFPACRL